MLFAIDYNDERVHINDTKSNKEYYCPACGAPLITRKGDIRKHHFAHKPNHICKDSWEREGYYDISPWHNEWQSLFPKSNQEIKLSLGETIHRADVLIDRTIIEFQHSTMSMQAFDNRNNFYFNLGYKVVWLFDLSDLNKNEQLVYTKENAVLNFKWNNPKRAFNSYDIQSGCIDLFFQLNDEEKCIVKVIDVSHDGFEKFTATDFMSKEEFLNYLGVKDNICSLPFVDNSWNDKHYLAFKEKYGVILNKQQERALLSVEGANLLLAVPGSGKTTVLVERLGHMVFNKKIKPEQLLCITYNNKAAEEMKNRFAKQFSKDISEMIDFRTINSLSLKIYYDYCKKERKKPRTLIQDKEKRQLLGKIYNKWNKEYANEAELWELAGNITYIKNMILRTDQIKEIESTCNHLSEMYNDYQNSLKKEQKMDFDDQMVYAYWVLENDEDILNELKSQYKYISVDEAQDTSKIQHAIIKKIAQGNNIFMVGDEDQSIYGFRGAYPKALLNFRYDYINPYILRMERNYRSTKEIVDSAQAFISRNKGRYKKNMTAEREQGEPLKLINVESREAQYLYLLEVAKKTTSETAFLYRDNESAVVLVDLLLRNNISYQHKKPELNFFNNKVVCETIAYLSLIINDKDYSAFEKICNKGIIYLRKQQKEYAINNCKQKGVSIYDALDAQMKYLPYDSRNRASNFRNFMQGLTKLNSYEAINKLLKEGYAKYLEKEKLDIDKVYLLQMIAKREPNIKNFLNRLELLEKIMKEEHYQDKNNKIILSTIHTSKGLEYDTVYMVDIYDGRFPSSRVQASVVSKDAEIVEQEERRLFYVGITRAKNSLYFFNIEKKLSSYIDELFPEQKAKREKEEGIKKLKATEEFRRKLYLKEQEAERKRREEYENRRHEIQQRIENQRKEEMARVKKMLEQQDEEVYSYNKRIIKCKICGKIADSDEFVEYGGIGSLNQGICRECSHNKRKC